MIQVNEKVIQIAINFIRQKVTMEIGEDIVNALRNELHNGLNELKNKKEDDKKIANIKGE